jgi:isoleucyl-tRNA synthetase
MTTERGKSLIGLDLAEISSSGWAEISICSGWTWHKATTWDVLQKEIPEGAFSLPDVPEVAVIIDFAQGKKCERCWQILPEVGTAANHPDLCHRCGDAVDHLRAKNA